MLKQSFPIIKTSRELKIWREKTNQNIGFVPTMGNLHAGHLKLVETALEKFEVVVISIFVNPTQFGPKEDFHRYPKTLEQDIELLTALCQKYQNKKLILFAPPNILEIYPENFNTQIRNLQWSTILEGAIRPGHFDGVCTVVSILLNLVRPHTILLGKKDYQQLRILEKMIHDLHMNSQIVAIETVRNDQGLALSSRNNFLTLQELNLAAKFPQYLKNIQSSLQNLWEKEKTWTLQKLPTFLKQATTSDFPWDYLELREQNFSELKPSSKNVVLLAVIRINSVRLLDNIEFNVG